MTNQRGNGMWHRDWLADASRRMGRWQAPRSAQAATLFRVRRPTLRLFGAGRSQGPALARLARHEVPMVLRARAPSRGLGEPILTVQSPRSVQLAEAAAEEAPALPPAPVSPETHDSEATPAPMQPSLLSRAAGSVLRLLRRESPEAPVAAQDGDETPFDTFTEDADETVDTSDEPEDSPGPESSVAPVQPAEAPSAEPSPRQPSGLGGLLLSLRRRPQPEAPAEAVAAPAPLARSPEAADLPQARPPAPAPPASMEPPAARAASPSEPERLGVPDAAPRMELRRSVPAEPPIARQETLLASDTAPRAEEPSPSLLEAAPADDRPVERFDASVASTETRPASVMESAAEPPAAPDAPAAETSGPARVEPADTGAANLRVPLVSRALAFLQRRPVPPPQPASPPLTAIASETSPRPEVATPRVSLSRAESPPPRQPQAVPDPAPLGLELRRRPSPAAPAVDTDGEQSIDTSQVFDAPPGPTLDIGRPDAAPASTVFRLAAPAPSPSPLTLVYRAARPAGAFAAAATSSAHFAYANGSHPAGNGAGLAYGQAGFEPLATDGPISQAALIGRSISVQRQPESGGAEPAQAAQEAAPAPPGDAGGEGPAPAPGVPLEKLAQQVYERLRQRLLLERERAGFQTVSW